MKSILLICTLCFVLFSCKQPQTQENSTRNKKPNIVFILVDDLGKEWLNCYGAASIETPHIDALAKSGMIFHNAYSMPQCTPSRVTLLTAQYPFRHGWVNHWDVPRWGAGAHFDETRNPSLVKELQKAGYKTAVAGKWQIDDFRVEPDAMSRNGFDDWCMWTGYETGIPASAERYQNPYLFTKAGSKTYEGKFGPDVFRDFIIDFIGQNKDSSFFVYFPMVLTHTPFVDTPDESADNKMGKHKAMLRYVDKITGQLVHALEEAQVRDNTLIVWTTDNGTSGQITGTLKGHAVKGAKSKTTEPGVSMPFIANWPGTVLPGTESEALIDFTDVLPTFLELAGVIPGEKITQGQQEYLLDGRSFKKALLNPDQKSEKDWILSMGGGNNAKRTENGVENQYKFRDRVLRDKQYKLYVNSNRQPEKFFDLKSDPFETQNLLENKDRSTWEQSFEALINAVETFPVQDSDPRYTPNGTQEWDVAISAKSQVWKK